VTEDDTFRHLSRDTFEQVLSNFVEPEDFITGMKLISQGNIFLPGSAWDEFGGKWTIEEFKEECARRVGIKDEHIRQQEGRMGLYDSGR